MNSLQEILLKDYELLSKEKQLYIKQVYLVFTAVFLIFTAGFFKGGLTYIFIPYIIAGLIGFMTVVAFYINKVAGYIRLIEERLNRIYGTIMPNPSNKISGSLSPLLWESYYADIDIKRDIGSQAISICGLTYIVMTLPVFILLLITLVYGYEEITKDLQGIFGITLGIIYIFTSTVLIGFSVIIGLYVDTHVRIKLIGINREILDKYTN